MPVTSPAASRRLRGLLVAIAVALTTLLPVGLAAPASATSAIDKNQGSYCIDHGFSCAGGGYAATAASTGNSWAFKYYGEGPDSLNGAGFINDATGTPHNCTLYAAWRLQQEGMGDPGASWGDAVNWVNHMAHDSNPTVGSVAWFGSHDHVAFVEQVRPGYVFVRADNYAAPNASYGYPSAGDGYTDAGWVPVGSVSAFLHPYPAGEGAGGASDGSFVSHNGFVYRMAGGAPIYVSSWTPFGGGQPTRALSDAEFAALRPVPADGTYIAGQSTGRVYRVAGGAPQYVSSWDHMGGAQPVVSVDDAAIENAGGGEPWNHLQVFPADGTYVSGQPSGRVFAVAGGAPLYVSSWANVGGGHPTTPIDDAAVDNAGATGSTWGHLRAVPADVFLLGVSSGRVYRVVSGGHPYYVSSWDPYGGPQPVVGVDQTAIDSCDHLRCGPFGDLNSATGGSGRVNVTGWAMDPNVTSPIYVDVYVDGKYATRLLANQLRTDVDNVFHRGARFGYAGWLPATAGTHQVCTYGINVGVGSNDQIHCLSATATADTTAPAVTTQVMGASRLTASTTFGWSATDAGSGVSSYDVRYRQAAFNDGFGAMQYPASWQKLSSTSVTQTGLARGYTYCYSVRARDHAGNLSAWSAERCTAVALDDRSLAGSGWTAGTGSAYMAGTYKSTLTLNRVLSIAGAQLSRVGVVATKCASCGVVGVYVNGVLVGKVNLYGATTLNQQIVGLPVFSYRTGTVALKVLTSGKQVLIDGVVISRA